MADSWQTIEQAAVSMRMSVRTVNRHISAGKLQSRLKDGRREVAVSQPEITAATDTSSQPTTGFAGFDSQSASSANSSDSNNGSSSEGAGAGQNAPPVTVDAERFLALADNATQKAEMAVNAYQMLARTADTQVRQVRQQARLAWALVALMTIGVTVAVGWTTQRLTHSSGEIGKLKEVVLRETNTNRALTDEQNLLRAERLQAERVLREEMASRLAAAKAEQSAAELSLRNEVTAARETAAEAQGALTAYRERDEADAARQREAESAVARNMAITASERIPAPSDTADTTPTPAPATQPVAEGSSTANRAAMAVAPTTKPVASRRKAKAPTTRPSGFNMSDTATPEAAAFDTH
jgi:hypothetical protein